MINFYHVITDNLIQFSGNGLLLTVWISCVIYIGFLLKKGPEKTLLCWYSFFVLAIYFCPVWIAYISLRDDAEILYRIFWLIPMGVVVSFALVSFAFQFEGKSRYFITLMLVLFIGFSGKFVYSSSHYSKAENVYHVPQTVVDICDSIIVPGREVRACFPDEMVQYVRQYTPLIFLPYGRSAFLNNGSAGYSDLRPLTNSDYVDAEEVVSILRESNTHYLIISSDKELSMNMIELDFVKVNSIDGYDIYRDTQAYLGLEYTVNNN